jgi:hypothetical protein
LRLVIGYALGDDPIEFAAGMAVDVLALGAIPTGNMTTTDESGLLEPTLTPSGHPTRSPHRIQIDARQRTGSTECLDPAKAEQKSYPQFSQASISVEHALGSQPSPSKQS